ncbi:MAG: hypothetical protein ACLQVD_16010 [Capsulimonadaceae bacterium]
MVISKHVVRSAVQVACCAAAGLAMMSAPTRALAINGPGSSHPVEVRGISISAGFSVGPANVFVWSEIPMGHRVPLRRCTFDEGGYQLYDTAGECVVVPFVHHNLYAMKFGISSGGYYFVNDGAYPVLYCPESGYLVNATVRTARWYPCHHFHHYHHLHPVFVGIAPSWSYYVAMGWYPDMCYYGGYWCDEPYGYGVAFEPTFGLTITIGGAVCSGWWSYYNYWHVHGAPYHMGFADPAVYRWASNPSIGPRMFRGVGHPVWTGRKFMGAGRAMWISRPQGNAFNAYASHHGFGGHMAPMGAAGAASALAGHRLGIAHSAMGMGSHRAGSAGHFAGSHRAGSGSYAAAHGSAHHYGSAGGRAYAHHYGSAGGRAYAHHYGSAGGGAYAHHYGSAGGGYGGRHMAMGSGHAYGGGQRYFHRTGGHEGGFGGGGGERFGGFGGGGHRGGGFGEFGGGGHGGGGFGGFGGGGHGGGRGGGGGGERRRH